MSRRPNVNEGAPHVYPQSLGVATSGPGRLDDAVLPAGVRSRFLEDVNGLRVHILEAGQPANPCVLLLHGFPELAYSWRYVMPHLADAGFHVVAPDLRGYGRTSGGDTDYDSDLGVLHAERLAGRTRCGLGVGAPGGGRRGRS
jgi:hypothetical protein